MNQAIYLQIPSLDKGGGGFFTDDPFYSRFLGSVLWVQIFRKNPGKKKPERIMALVMIMGLSLLIYALTERKLRLALQEENVTIPDQKGKPTDDPTMRWVFQTFEGIDVLSVWSGKQVVIRQMLNLRLVHSQIIRLMGSPIQKCYLEGT